MNSNYGLALAGGGTRGAYHIGAWKALSELGFDFTAIVGTSIGSVNGALFAQGDFDIAVEFWKRVKIDDIFELDDELKNSINLLDYKNIVPLLSEAFKKKGLRTKPFEELLKSVLDENKLRNSKIKYGLNTTSVSTLESEELFIDNIPEGKLIDAVMASSCFPGFQKRYIDDKAYRDGGIMNNLPLDMLFKLGYKNIIAIDVGGVGLVRNDRRFDENITYIRPNKTQIGMFEFDISAIERTVRQGYYDTYKVMGRLMGMMYYFNTADYSRAKALYSEEILSGLEYAAEILGINQMAVYRVDDLISGVLKKFKKLKYPKGEYSPENILKITSDSAFALAKFVELINKGKTGGFKLMTGVLGNRLNAAIAVAYFLKQ